MSLTLKTLRPAVDRLETGLVRAHVHRLSISKSRQSGWKDAPTFRFTEPLCIFRSVHLSKSIIWSHHTTSERRKCQKKGAKEKREREKKGPVMPRAPPHLSLHPIFLPCQQRVGVVCKPLARKETAERQYPAEPVCPPARWSPIRWGEGSIPPPSSQKKGKKQEDNGQGRNWKESPVVMQFRRSAPSKRWCSS